MDISSSGSEEDVTSSDCDDDIEEESSCEAEEDEDKLEIAKICGETLQLPQRLCENKDIFKEILSMKTFNSLSEINKQHLKNFLPTFPENDEHEKTTTLQKFFNRETFRFDSPLVQFHDKLRNGYYRPDIARIRKLLKQEQKKEYKYQRKVYYKRLLNDVLISRCKTIRSAQNLPPGNDVKLNHDKHEKQHATNGIDYSPRAFRTKRRYFQELAQINAQVDDDNMEWSEDENYPEGPPMRLSKKLKRHLNGLQNSGSFQNLPNVEKTVVSTLASKPTGLDLENTVTSSYNPYQLNEDSYRALLFAHKKRKRSFDTNPELITKGVNLKEVMQRTQLIQNKKSSLSITTTNSGSGSKHHESKEHISTSNHHNHHHNNNNSAKTSSNLVKRNKKVSMDSSQKSLYSPDLVINKPPPSSSSSSLPPPSAASSSLPPLSSVHSSLFSSFNQSQISSNSEQDNSDSDEFIDPVLTSPTPTPVTSKQHKKLFSNNNNHNNNNKSIKLTAKQSQQQQQSMLSSSSSSSIAAAAAAATINYSNVKLEYDVPVKKELDSVAATIKIEQNLIVDPPQISISDSSCFVSGSGGGGVGGIGARRLIPASISDLDGIDMMSLPVDLEDSNIDILDEIDPIEQSENGVIKDELLDNVKQELLMQETHANYLSLIRDVICSTSEHRMSLNELEERLKNWQSNPITPLNTWYSLVDNWLNLLPSAIAFLTGNMVETPDDYVPYLEYKPNLHLYQWIGAGRDSDNSLNALCQFWLEHRDDNVQSLLNINVNNLKLTNSQITEEIIVKPATPPPPRCPTNWMVRKAEPQEIEEFQEQERQRYANPHKSFTYKMNGYESIVGPVKGMYNQTSGLSKARGHSMLSADRPNFVTILTLVRDAVARLPNGEGTRADICELLKSSQYISQCAPENVLQSVVSGALDRLHTEYDPSVKYDTKKKIWIYLHRSRTETDFERIHQQFQGLSKQIKKNSRKNKTTKPKADKNVNNTANNLNTTTAATVPAVTAAAAATTTTTPSASSLTNKTPLGRTGTPTSIDSSIIMQQEINNINATNKLTMPIITSQAAAGTAASATTVVVSKPFKSPPINRVFTVASGANNTNVITTSNNKTLQQQQQQQQQQTNASLLVNSNLFTIRQQQCNSPKTISVQASALLDKDTEQLLETNLNALDQSDRQHIKIIASTIAPTEQDIEKAIQTLTPIRVASPINATGIIGGGGKQSPNYKTTTTAAAAQKSLVKIINPQGKSIINSNNIGQVLQQQQQQQQQTVFIKQIDGKTQAITGKNLLNQPQITQQLLQTLAAQQKLKSNQQQQQQQQQQTIKTAAIVVTSQQLIKTDGNQKPIQTIANAVVPQQQQQIIQSNVVNVNQTNISQQLLQAISQQQQQHQQQQQKNTTLIAAQQQQQLQPQQILQTIKQKTQNQQQQQQSVLTLQQAINKQTNMQQLQKQLQQQQQIIKGTSLLGQQRIITQVGGAKTVTTNQNQTPLVAKVLTNAAGQVISVESLLAHQKQHGSLPQGTTLRVSSTKPGQTNLIQLSGNAANQIQQFAVVSQNNIVSLTNSNNNNNNNNSNNRLATNILTSTAAATTTLGTGVVSSSAAAGTPCLPVTTVVTVASPKTITTKPQTIKQQTAKFLPASNKLAHQLVNAKFVTQNSKLLPHQKIQVQVNQPIKINAATLKQQQQQQQSIIATGTTTTTPTPTNVTKLANAAIVTTTSTAAGVHHHHQQQQQQMRMVNTTGLNLASFAGKPVLFASKGSTLQNLQSLQGLQGQNVILQAATGQTSNSIVLPNNARVITHQGGNTSVGGSVNISTGQAIGSISTTGATTTTTTQCIGGGSGGGGGGAGSGGIGTTQVVLGTTQLNQIKVQNLVQQSVVGSNQQQIVLTGQNLKQTTAAATTNISGINNSSNVSSNNNNNTNTSGSNNNNNSNNTTTAATVVNMSSVQAQNAQNNTTTQTVVLGGAIKMTGTNNRVVLASQGSSGQIVAQQILLPSNFQGGAINIKTLQGLKVIPLAQTTPQTKGRPQVFARIMNPQNARITQLQQQTSTQLNENANQTNNPD